MEAEAVSSAEAAGASAASATKSLPARTLGALILFVVSYARTR